MLQRGMETFLAVVRYKTLKGAADRLNLAQSTVSKRLQQLEQECGIVLFERGRGGKAAVLTPAGERFTDVAERMLDLYHEARNVRPEKVRYHLTIGSPTSLQTVFMPALYSRLLEREPLLRVTGISLQSMEMCEAIELRRIDIGFCLLERTHPGVTTERCYSEPIIGVLVTDSSRPDGETIALETLDPDREIRFPWTPHRAQMWHERWVPGESSRLLVDDPSVLARVMNRPGQWTLVPRSAARLFFAHGPFRIFRPQPEPPDRVCYKITHKHPRTQVAEALSMIREHLAAVLHEEFGGDLTGRGIADTATPPSTTKRPSQR